MHVVVGMGLLMVFSNIVYYLHKLVVVSLHGLPTGEL